MLHTSLAEKIEFRIMVGITSFLGLMVLIGWVAINEQARMKDFEEQHLARAIERGAALFSTNCSECHGKDGRGIEGFGPALNSPLVFGYDYFAEIDNQIKGLNATKVQLEATMEALQTELTAEDTTDERKQEIESELAEISDQLSGEESIDVQLADLDQQRQQLISQLQPAVDKGYPIGQGFDANGSPITVIQNDRLAQVEWTGTLYDYIFTTLVHGRPTSKSYWENSQMVAWSQRAGGPLRDDQISDLTYYILNFDKGDKWTLEDALAVNQYPLIPGLGGGDASSEPPIANNIDDAVEQVVSGAVVGDPIRGEALYTSAEASGRNSRLACSGCHLGGVAAPDTIGQWDNILNDRLTLEQYAGQSPEYYVIESIIDPGAYVVDGYVAGVMPGDFGSRITVQDAADIIAYLQTQSASD